MYKIMQLFLVSIFIFGACTSSEESHSQTDNSVVHTNDDVKLDIIAVKEDTVKLLDIFNYAKSKELNKSSFSEIEIEVAKQLLNIPYVAATLEQDGEEKLVVNLRGLDCTTFLENVIAISYCIKADNTKFNDYFNILTMIRYRGGKIDKYPSRLHYFSDWLLDNEYKGIVRIVSNEFGNAEFDPTVGFMSKNPDKYSKLAKNPDFVPIIAMQEDSLTKAKLKYITKDQLETYVNKIKDGDLIAFTTTINGLDISHVGIAAFHNERLHFYHASSSKKKVVLSEKPMSEYLAGIKHNNGVIVARVAE